VVKHFKQIKVDFLTRQLLRYATFAKPKNLQHEQQKSSFINS
jgi:hypothetical protein